MTACVATILMKYNALTIPRRTEQQSKKKSMISYFYSDILLTIVPYIPEPAKCNSFFLNECSYLAGKKASSTSNICHFLLFLYKNLHTM